MKFLHKLAWALLVLLALVSLAGLLGDHFWFLDLINHFRPQLLFLSLAIHLFSFIRKMKYLRIAAFVLLLLNLFCVRSAFDISNRLEHRKDHLPQYLFLSANLYKYNEDHESILKLIDDLNPDIIWLMEVTPKCFDDIYPHLADQYRYHLKRTREDSYGIAMFSRYDFHAEVKNFKDTHIPYVDAYLNNEDIRFIGLHASSPISEKRVLMKKRELQEITELVKDETKPLVVMGDFNETPWTNNFKNFVKESGLRNASVGYGFIYTWPTWIFPLATQIDHAFIKNISDGSFESHRNIGSDHYPISFQVLE
jgi:endonuclease/exonuclease/phosphatase (EEP) superfamily protein YafD